MRHKHTVPRNVTHKSDRIDNGDGPLLSIAKCRYFDEAEVHFVCDECRVSRSTMTSAKTESTQMFELIFYQLMVLRITVGLVLSSKRYISTQARAI